MPRKTNSDIIRDLESTVATHNERIEHVRQTAEAIQGNVELERKYAHDQFSGLTKELSSLAKEQAVLQHRVGELERVQRSRTAFLWTLFGIILGGILSFVGNLLLRSFSPQ